MQIFRYTVMWSFLIDWIESAVFWVEVEPICLLLCFEKYSLWTFLSRKSYSAWACTLMREPNACLLWMKEFHMFTFLQSMDGNFTTVVLLRIDCGNMLLSGLWRWRVCMCSHFGTVSRLQHRDKITDALFHTGVIKSGALDWHYWSLIGKFILEESAEVLIWIDCSLFFFASIRHLLLNENWLLVTCCVNFSDICNDSIAHNSVISVIETIYMIIATRTPSYWVKILWNYRNLDMTHILQRHD